MPRRLAFFAALCLLLPALAACEEDIPFLGGETALPTATPTATPLPTFEPLAIETLVFEVINRVRAEHGLAVLAWDESLAAVARAHSADMAARDFFAHENPDGLDPTGRGEVMGVTCSKVIDDTRYTGIGENLIRTAAYESITITTRDGEEEGRAYDWRTLEGIAEHSVQGWMDSPGHRENILNPVWDRHGLGVVVTADYTIFITDNFC
jgi:uncharacterized protein YkwD